MSDELLLRVFDVEHGACTILGAPSTGRLAMIDCGHNDSTGWRPSAYVRNALGRSALDYLFVQNADNDHVSDLPGFRENGVAVSVLHRNPTPGPELLKLIKLDQSSRTTKAIDHFIEMHGNYAAPVSIPFDHGMGGVTCTMFWNRWPWFWKTNDLSLVVFIKYGPFKMLFPGDMEEAGWKNLLAFPPFVRELQGTTILMASHHGRENGFCRELFDHFTPSAVVISDKPVAHLTQDLDYRPVVDPHGVAVLNQGRRRHVLTTRKDGDILFRVQANGIYTIETANDWYSQRAA